MQLPHPLHYLDFDFSDEETGRGSFDAMASVAAERLPALLAEIAAVLGWAVATFGLNADPEDGGDWDCDLQGIGEPDTPLDVAFDETSGVLSLTPAAGHARTTLTVTLSGSPEFCSAFKERFGIGDGAQPT